MIAKVTENGDGARKQEKSSNFEQILREMIAKVCKNGGAARKVDFTLPHGGGGVKRLRTVARTKKIKRQAPYGWTDGRTDGRTDDHAWMIIHR